VLIAAQVSQGGKLKRSELHPVNVAARRPQGDGMSTNHVRPIEPLDGVLVANAARARLFVRDAQNRAMREVVSFVHPRTRMKASTLGHDRPGQAIKGAARTAYEPHTDPHHKELTEFARELMQRLEEEALQRRFPRVAILASNPFLGELKAHIGATTGRLLVAAVPLDLTEYLGAELERRVAQALADASPPPAAG
jgi:protein required for attachment to host cells